MSVRRQATRLAAVCVTLGGLLAAGASPALAASDSVRVRSSDSFRPGGSPGSVTIEVRKRTAGCVVVRTGLGLRLAGLSADQVAVSVSVGGRWWPLPVSGGGGAVTAGRATPAEPTLCKGKKLTMRHRVAFLAGTAGGRLTVVGEAVSSVGRAIDRDTTAARVLGQAKAATPSPTPTRSPSASPSPSLSPSAEPTTGEAGVPTVAAVAGTAGGAGAVNAAREGSGGLSWLMVVGVGLVVAGAGLIVLLVRRSRKDREPADDAGALPGMPLPRNPGGTTYRSAAPRAGGVPGQVPPPIPGVPGQVPPPTPGVYGRPAAPPSGSVYGSRPPASPPGGGGPGGGGPGEPPAPAGGGDSTTIMPRLPG
jgi:hypothetical protein